MVSIDFACNGLEFFAWIACVLHRNVSYTFLI